ncbi:Uncharacterised protein [Bordetella pertussis]|nr:Uncharacterised protein [Bordetella pertussis]
MRSCRQSAARASMSASNDLAPSRPRSGVSA